MYLVDLLATLTPDEAAARFPNAWTEIADTLALVIRETKLQPVPLMAIENNGFLELIVRNPAMKGLSTYGFVRAPIQPPLH